MNDLNKKQLDGSSELIHSHELDQDILNLHVEILNWFHFISRNTFFFIRIHFQESLCYNFFIPEHEMYFFAVFEEYRVCTANLRWFCELYMLHNMIQLLHPIISRAVTCFLNFSLLSITLILTFSYSGSFRQHIQPHL